MRIVKPDSVLKTYRDRHGLTREELRLKLRCSYSLVQLIEDGYRKITPAKAVKWEPILEIPREELCPDIFRKAEAA